MLGCYLHGFAQACKSHPAGWYALDVFAGGGLNISQTTGAEIAGSALIALEAAPPAAQRVVLAEYSTRMVPALTARLAPHGGRARLFVGDANARIAEMLGLLPRNAPAFAFLDPEGSELAWATVAAIAAHKAPASNKIEQLILLPTDMGFVRMLPLEAEPDGRSASKLDLMYGHARWREIYDRRRAGQLTPDQARTAYVDLYADGLRALGYRHVQEREINKEGAGGKRGAPMYFLLHATDNDTGERIMAWCFDKKHMRPAEELGQIQLLQVPVAPRRRRVSSPSADR